MFRSLLNFFRKDKNYLKIIKKNIPCVYPIVIEYLSNDSELMQLILKKGVKDTYFLNMFFSEIDDVKFRFLMCIYNFGYVDKVNWLYKTKKINYEKIKPYISSLIYTNINKNYVHIIRFLIYLNVINLNNIDMNKNSIIHIYCNNSETVNLRILYELLVISEPYLDREHKNNRNKTICQECLKYFCKLDFYSNDISRIIYFIERKGFDMGNLSESQIQRIHNLHLNSLFG